MAIPPERITIKRRREEEPVEALYIEQKRRRSNNTYWVRINDEKPFDGHNTSLSRQYLHSLKGSNNQRHQSESRILETQQTKHNNDTISEPPDFSGHFVQGIENFAQDAHAVNRSGKFPEAQVPSDMDKRVRDTTMSGRQPRTFYLSSDAKSLSSQSMVLVNGVMSSKSRRQDLAVFEEKIIAAMDPSVAKAEFQKGADLSGQGAGTSSVSNERSHSNATVWPAARAGPGISVVERWPEAIDVDGIIRRQQDVDEIVTHLPDTILQEAQAKAINGTPLEAHIKFQPKPAKARRGENRLLAADFNPGEASHGAQDLQRQSDFVYDTYLRTNQPLVGSQLGSPMDIDQLDSIVDGKIGVLVIGEEDEAEWETYAEDEKSDKDWNSEDEDENAEDFYANDYPEDEVDSDDEYDRSAYRYRSHASDEEEFDEDKYNWSNDEDEATHGWNNELG